MRFSLFPTDPLQAGRSTRRGARRTGRPSTPAALLLRKQFWSWYSGVAPVGSAGLRPRCPTLQQGETPAVFIIGKLSRITLPLRLAFFKPCVARCNVTKFPRRRGDGPAIYSAQPRGDRRHQRPKLHPIRCNPDLGPENKGTGCRVRHWRMCPQPRRPSRARTADRDPFNSGCRPPRPLQRLYFFSLRRPPRDTRYRRDPPPARAKHPFSGPLTSQRPMASSPVVFRFPQVYLT